MNGFIDPCERGHIVGGVYWRLSTPQSDAMMALAAALQQHGMSYHWGGPILNASVRVTSDRWGGRAVVCRHELGGDDFTALWQMRTRDGWGFDWVSVTEDAQFFDGLADSIDDMMQMASEFADVDMGDL